MTEDYVSPAVRIITLDVDNVICGSPLPGGNEDIGYEDWCNKQTYFVLFFVKMFVHFSSWVSDSLVLVYS